MSEEEVLDGLPEDEEGQRGEEAPPSLPELPTEFPRGNTAIDQLPEHIYMEVRSRLAARYRLEDVRRWLTQMGYPHITARMLSYYRTKYIPPNEILGDKYLTKFLHQYHISLDTLAAMEQLTAAQLARVQRGVQEEHEADTVIPAIGSEVDRAMQAIKMLRQMKQEAGLEPQPIPKQLKVAAQVEAQVEQQVSGELTVEGGVPSVPEEVVKQFSAALAIGYQQLAIQQELEEDQGEES